jgi:glycosyltransferase involved in cell wall biosynthesis/SAM-dependent methyltransferase
MEYAIHLARYPPLRDLVKGRRVLDASCGEGYGSQVMAQEWGAKSVTGVDISAEAIARAKARFSAPNLIFVESSLEAYLEEALKRRAGNAPFDAIVSVETLEHLENPRKAIAGFKALLAPQGMIYLTIPNDAFYFGKGAQSLNKYHKHIFDFATAKALAEPLLGPGHWSLGSVAAGFSSYPLERISEAKDFSALPGAGSAMLAAGIAAGPSNSLRPEGALYFAGFWDFAAGQPLPAASALYPVPAAFRLPRLDTRPPAGGGLAKANGAGAEPLRLAMVADVEGWAFDNIAKSIGACLQGRVVLEILYLKDLKTAELFARLFLEGAYDHVHFLWREPLLHFFFDEGFAAGILERLEKKLGLARKKLIARLVEGFRRTSVTFGVYDHLHLHKEEIEMRRAAVALLDGYGVSSQRLAKIWSGHFGLAPSALLPDGVDLELFHPQAPGSHSWPRAEFVVGWVGNSAWNRKDGTEDPKGLETILTPALEKLREEGLRLRGHFADRHERWRPRDEMPVYYGEIDLLVCCSAIEGTPNPVLEAMACGLPVVSTDVGIVPELFGLTQQDFIVERNIESLADAIRQIAQDPALARALSEENLDRIRDWEWIDQAPKWLHLLAEANRVRRSGRGQARAAYLKLFLEKLGQGGQRGRGFSRRLTGAYWTKKANKLFREGRI